MFEIKLFSTPTQQENLVLTDSQPWFLLVVWIPYDSLEFRKSTCFFCETNLTSHWISISTLQALSTCHIPASWWFQPCWKRLVKNGNLPQIVVKNKKYWKPPPSQLKIAKASAIQQLHESPREHRRRLRPQLACRVRAHPGMRISKIIILKWEGIVFIKHIQSVLTSFQIVSLNSKGV